MSRYERERVIDWKVVEVSESRFELVRTDTQEARAAGSRAAVEAALRLYTQGQK